MKALFKNWLIAQNSYFINEFGIDCILSKVNSNLKVINSNKEETEILAILLGTFFETITVFEA
ncbi:hypothetical protein BKG95_02250 [Rodentibacter pneumotropicus]|uniref:Uncharacterized protein n=1 Tax=Rodentibacter pneumotropicus TaxID=758 RepID=A0AAW5LBV5_9PAST|nr:hypothetical protein [Rodentibacter pneumotropicus]MCQ9120935.1 hypothetical protein [Rodentibacter pneumotropicus]OOF69106.1 hypothetical protein BKG95_02250 [Rodentibacter pneumotropicus]